jgi:hypothetical protein
MEHLSDPGHIDDHDLERYHLGMVKDEAELAALEEHLLWCNACVDHAEATARYVDAGRSLRMNHFRFFVLLGRSTETRCPRCRGGPPALFLVPAANRSSARPPPLRRYAEVGAF